jgi:hypothetical protein
MQNQSLLDSINSGGTIQLMGSDEIDNLINSQIGNINSDSISPNQPNPQVNTIPPIPQKPQMTQPEPEPQINTNSNTSNTSNFNPEEEMIIGFDLTSMNTNLDEIVVSTKQRIVNLQKKQDTLNSRINLMEKFIILDEKDLALEIAKKDQNFQRLNSLRKNISSQTELMSEIMDILLKFEDSILKWTQALMNIEKDKVSAFQKIKSITKEVSKSDEDINTVLSGINTFIHQNPNLVNEAKNTLNMNGYGGKPFNQ